MLMYTIQVTIYPIRMKVFVCFAAICFLALVMAQEEDVDESPAVRMPRSRAGVFLFGLYIIIFYEKFHNKVLYRIVKKYIRYACK